MNQRPPVVETVEATNNGVHCRIHGKDLCWNKSKDQFFELVNRKWVKTNVTDFQKKVLKERQSAWAYKEKRIANTGKFRKTHDWFDNQAFKSQERNA